MSAAALNSTRARLGDKGEAVKWIVADATEWLPTDSYDIWHDRAAFHFLTSENEQLAYIKRLKQALKRGAESLSAILAPDFNLIDSRHHEHITPWKAVQKFQFSTFRYSYET